MISFAPFFTASQRYTVQQNSHLSQDITEMFKLAKAAQQKAYAPYSHFNVGACIRADNGKYYQGCNIENASYPLTLCAEATAMALMIADGAKKILEVAVIGSSDKPCSPCGACRQRLREFADQQLVVHMFDQHGNCKSMSFTELLPESFGPEFLGNK